MHTLSYSYYVTPALSTHVLTWSEWHNNYSYSYSIVSEGSPGYKMIYITYSYSINSISFGLWKLFGMSYTSHWQVMLQSCMPFIFHTYEDNYTQKEHELASIVSKYWGNFVKTGNPNTGNTEESCTTDTVSTVQTQFAGLHRFAGWIVNHS